MEKDSWGNILNCFLYERCMEVERLDSWKHWETTRLALSNMKKEINTFK